MRYILSSIFLLVQVVVFSQQNEIDKLLDQAYSLLRSNPDSAGIMAKNILEDSKGEDNLYGQIKANFILGYLSKANNDFGVSVVYYLEGIRLAESTDYPEIYKDKIHIRRNLGNIFKSFRANALAIKYYSEAIELAKEHKELNQQISLMLNLGLVYQDNLEYSLALGTFDELLKIVSTSYRYRVLNQIGIIHLQNADYLDAKNYFDELLDITPEDHNLHAKALHNLGAIEFHKGLLPSSIQYLDQAVAVFTGNGQDDFHGLFNSYRTLGTYLFYDQQYDRAEETLLKAIDLIEYTKTNPESFEAYKTLSDLYYSIGDKDKGRFYQEEYFRISQEYIALQQKIQQKDKEYNFELITKRYFDDVKKQDRLASVMMYSKISIGGLLVLLIMVVTYFQSEKIRMRKSIEKELKSLKVLR